MPTLPTICPCRSHGIHPMVLLVSSSKQAHTDNCEIRHLYPPTPPPSPSTPPLSPTTSYHTWFTFILPILDTALPLGLLDFLDFHAYSNDTQPEVLQPTTPAFLQYTSAPSGSSPSNPLSLPPGAVCHHQHPQLIHSGTVQPHPEGSHH